MPLATRSRHAAQAPLAFIACGLLAACSSPEDDATDAPNPAPALTANPVMTAAPDGAPLASGEWTISEDASGASARFGQPNATAVLSLDCDTASQQLSLTRESAGIEGSDMQTYILEAGGQKASLDMHKMSPALPLVTAEVNRSMPIFGAFADMSGVITMTAPDGDVLRVQGAPGIGRVIEACSR